MIRELFWASRPLSWVNTAYPFTAAVLLGMLVWLRHQARRLNQAFLEQQRHHAPRP